MSAEASQMFTKNPQLSVIGVPLQAGTLITVVVAVLLGKNSFAAQDAATQNVANEINELRKETTELRSDLKTQSSELDKLPAMTIDLATAKFTISTLQAEREKLEARVHLLEECVRSKARCRL
jgi:septal ring factor EnvC (AmiA/AmiB activator)